MPPQLLMAEFGGRDHPTPPELQRQKQQRLINRIGVVWSAYKYSTHRHDQDAEFPE